ncbi:hypothetical protein C5167_025038 [Papaver somniferum]|uniref:Uncharacterized protein n=1 Tax=Papaver somniferum TaxID=3469 RepID=A0A4Y7JU32_PAPSO|nr:hypothetical protein C5167_025038 [Papaver somniferum]
MKEEVPESGGASRLLVMIDNEGLILTLDGWAWSTCTPISCSSYFG